MVVKMESKTIKEIDLTKLIDSNSVFVGYPENSTRTDSDLTDAQIAFLNTKGTRPNSTSAEIKSIRKENRSTYSDALATYIRSKGEPRWHIPPRPFVEPAIEKILPRIQPEMKEAIITAIEGKDNKDILNRIGLRARNAVQQFIRNYPGNGLIPNAPSTIKSKGEDHPLKGKLGSLLSHVTWIVE